MFAAGVLVAFMTPAARSDQWLMPGDLLLRHDLTLLADAGILRGPQMTWPVSWPDVARDVESASAEQADGAAVAQALQRVQQAARRAALPGAAPVEVTIAGGTEPDALRGFAWVPRERGEATGAVAWLGERFSANVRVTAVTDAADGQDVRFDGSYLGATFGNVVVTAGFVDRWWAPGWDGSLILGTNSRPIPSLAFDRRQANASRLPVLRWFGPWRVTVVFGQGEGSDVAVPDTKFFGARVSSRPSAWLEIGLSRNAQWCGEGRPCDFETFVDMLVGRDNYDPAAGNSKEPGNQMAGYDLRVSSPWPSLPIALYGQFVGEDEAGGLPAKFLGQFGGEVWGGHPVLGSWRLRYEYADTACSFSRGDPQFNCAYRNGLYPQGYAFRDRIVGSSLDNDGRMWSASALLARPGGLTISATLRGIELNRDGAPDPSHRLSPDGASSLASFDLRFDSTWSGTAFSLALGYDDYDEGRASDSGLRGFLRLTRGF